MAFNNGYIRIYAPEHKNADNNGLVYEHQIVAEEKIGRPLKEEEVVHHIDRNRANNSPSNLLIFSSNSDHVAFHHGRDYIIDEEGIAHCEPLKSIGNTCLICGNKIHWQSKYCEECSHFVQRRVEDRPDREQLKNLIRRKPFVQIAKIYGVTDNAIRKWCKSENLPYKSEIIKKISDEEWDKL